MLTLSPPSFLALLLLTHLPPSHPQTWHSILSDADTLTCATPYKLPTPSFLPDCLTALAMIPTGLTLDPPLLAQHNPPASPKKPITLALDKRRYRLPAAFRASTCVIRIWATRPRAQPPRPVPRFEAGELYFKVFPRAREAVVEILERCVAPAGEAGEAGMAGHGAGRAREGAYTYDSVVEGQAMQWEVRVKHQLKGGRTDMWMPGDDHPHRGNVYNARVKEDWNPPGRRHAMTLRGGAGRTEGGTRGVGRGWERG